MFFQEALGNYLASKTDVKFLTLGWKNCFTRYLNTKYKITVWVGVKAFLWNSVPLSKKIQRDSKNKKRFCAIKNRKKYCLRNKICRWIIITDQILKTTYISVDFVWLNCFVFFRIVIFTDFVTVILTYIFQWYVIQLQFKTSEVDLQE